mmetsp:Transcript_117088/g.335940  ORF Transcript_117088/g.335940 Transcript_117088/m.335940 type:complete len:231 (+) Transcript_117088:204-896(+)
MITMSEAAPIAIAASAGLLKPEAQLRPKQIRTGAELLVAMREFASGALPAPARVEVLAPTCFAEVFDAAFLGAAFGGHWSRKSAIAGRAGTERVTVLPRQTQDRAGVVLELVHACEAVLSTSTPDPAWPVGRAWRRRRWQCVHEIQLERTLRILRRAVGLVDTFLDVPFRFVGLLGQAVRFFNRLVRAGLPGRIFLLLLRITRRVLQSRHEAELLRRRVHLLGGVDGSCS